jgi:phage-related protein
MMNAPNPVEILGSLLDDLRAFPGSARHEAGNQIDRVQQGYQANDSNPMPTIGAGVQEIMVRDAAGAFRVIDVARFADAVYVLHCFRKTTQKTARPILAWPPNVTMN